MARFAPPVGVGGLQPGRLTGVPDEANVPLPVPAASAVPAQWLTSRIATFGSNWVTSTAGTGWQAYCRLFHPLDDTPHAPRWADIAAAHGHTMHPGAQWHVISRDEPGSSLEGRGYPGEPLIGQMQPHTLTTLNQILEGHTETPDRCWFAVWEGWGWMHDGAHSLLTARNDEGDVNAEAHAPHEWQLDLTGPTFALPGRRYHLFTGPLQAATRTGTWVTSTWFDPQSPSLFWPEDHAWCAATEIDYDTTFIGGNRDLIDAITGDPLLEALRIDPHEPRSDTVNT